MITIAATTEMYIDLWCSVATAGWLVGSNAMLQSRRQCIGVVDHAGGESANLRNSLRWAYLPLSVAILAVVAATDVTPAVFAVVVAMAGFTAERSQRASRLRERQRRLELGTTSPSTRGTAAEMQYFRSDTGLGAERDWERFEAAAGHVIRAGRTTMSLIVAGGSDVGSHMPPNRAFSLGGLLLTGRGACLCLLDGASPVPPAPC